MRTFILSVAALLSIARGQYNNQYNQNHRNQPYQQQGYQPNQNQNGYNNYNGHSNQNGYNSNNNMQNRNQNSQNGYMQQNNQYQRTMQQSQQQQYGQQFAADTQQQGASKGTSRTVVSNTPVKATASNTNGTRVDIQLISYSNPSNSLSNLTTCFCPITNCLFLKSTEQNNCQFSFATVISASDQTVKYLQSDFYPFTQTIATGNWTNPLTMEMGTKPVAIDVFVQHLGVVINKKDATLQYFNHLALVDSFALPLLQLDPSQSNGQATVQTTLKSQLQPESSLSIKISVACINDFMGANCDMLCGQGNATNTNSDTTLCKNVVTGLYQQCKQTSSRTVTNCVQCVQVDLATNKCTLNGENTAVPVGVSPAFRTWTIILGCLLGLAILLILCLIIAYIIIRNRDRSYEDEPAVYKNGSTHPYQPTTTSPPTHTTQTTRDEWTSPARRPLLPHDESRQSEDSYIRDGVTTVRTVTTTKQRQEHQV